MYSISEYDKLWKNYQIERHIPEAALAARITENANMRGINLNASQEKIKTGGFFSSAEDCVRVLAFLIIQRRQGAYNFLYIYEIAGNVEHKNTTMEDVVSLFSPGAGYRREMEKSERNQIILDIIETSIGELLEEPDSAYDYSSSDYNNTYSDNLAQASNNTYTEQASTTNYNTASTTNQNSVNYSNAKGEKTYIGTSRITNDTKQTSTTNNTYVKSNTTNSGTANNTTNDSQSSTSNANASEEKSGGCLSAIFGIGVFGVLCAIVVAIGTSMGLPVPVSVAIFIIGSIIYLSKK